MNLAHIKKLTQRARDDIETRAKELADAALTEAQSRVMSRANMGATDVIIRVVGNDVQDEALTKAGSLVLNSLLADGFGATHHHFDHDKRVLYIKVDWS